MANGATNATARRVLEAMGFELVVLGDTPDGRNINLACGSTHPAGLSAAVVAHGCRLGVAFDGDGDRAILVDHRGRVIDGDAVLLMLALDLHRQGRLHADTVVATVMSNIGLEIALREKGITMLHAVAIADVMESMLQNGYVLGGEQSGHIILSEHLFTGDGLATTLAVLRAMVSSGRDLAGLASDLVTYPQTLVNVRVREKKDVRDVPEIADAMAQVEAALGSQGRLLVRYSGTEPLLRVMIEGQDQATVQAWAEEIAEAVRDAGVTKLSVNVNKIATLRNSRGGHEPAVLAAAVETCVAAGAPGITVIRVPTSGTFARATCADRRVAQGRTPHVEFNIEGDPRDDRSTSCSRCVRINARWCPVSPGEITSQAGWSPARLPAGSAASSTPCGGGRARQLVRRSGRDAVRWAASCVPIASSCIPNHSRAFATRRRPAASSTRTLGAVLAASLGLGVNAGHDLDLDNLVLFVRCRTWTKSRLAMP